MVGKLSRSWQLVKSSARVLSAAPELAILPVLGHLGAAAVAAAIYFGIVEPLGLQDVFQNQSSTEEESELLKAEHLLVVFLMYLGTSFAMTFFNVALASAALTRFREGRGGVGTGLACAAGKIAPILGFAALVAVLGLVRKFLRERGGVGGRIASDAVGLAAGVATFLVTPVIAAEDVNPLSAIRRSAVLLRNTWGENIVGGVGFSLVFVLAIFGLVGIGGAAALLFAAEDGFGVPGIVVIALVGVAIVALTVVWSALAGIYRAGLYAYAVDGSVPEGFERVEFEEAFRQKAGAAAAAS